MSDRLASCHPVGVQLYSQQFCGPVWTWVGPKSHLWFRPLAVPDTPSFRRCSFSCSSDEATEWSWTISELLHGPEEAPLLSSLHWKTPSTLLLKWWSHVTAGAGGGRKACVGFFFFLSTLLPVWVVNLSFLQEVEGTEKERARNGSRCCSSPI